MFTERMRLEKSLPAPTAHPCESRGPGENYNRDSRLRRNERNGNSRERLIGILKFLGIAIFMLALSLWQFAPLFK
jgi:hypothetical protein